MKKILIVLIICLTAPYCFSQEKSVNQTAPNEIYLDTGTSCKDYKLTKPSYQNSKDDINNIDDTNELPVDFMTSPLQLLKQYSGNNY